LLTPPRFDAYDVMSGRWRDAGGNPPY